MNNIIPFNYHEKEIRVIEDIGTWKKDNLGCVYVILDDLERIKIGSSLTPLKRIKNVASAAGVFVKKSHISKKAYDYKDAEIYIQKIFLKYRTYGEWFTGLEFARVQEEVDNYKYYIPKNEDIYQATKSSKKKFGLLAGTISLGAKKSEPRGVYSSSEIAAFDQIRELMFGGFVFYETPDGVCILDNRTEWLKASERMLGREERYYTVPEKARHLAVIHPTKQRHEDGTPVFELHWKESVIEKLKAEAK